MRKRHQLFLMITACTLWLSCLRDPFPEQKTIADSSIHNVSLVEVERLTLAMARGNNMTKTAEFRQPEIIPIVDIYKDTLFYAVNFFPGWKLISSDKRTPFVLAENEQGEFSLCDMDYGAGLWLECMAQDLKEVKRSPTWTLPDENSSVYFETFWDSLLPSDTKSNESYYDIYTSYTERVTDREVAHLTSTQWGQHNPYNLLCPYKSDLSNRAPAGCVAVAGAQILYYLHNKIGLPTDAPTRGYCYGSLPYAYYQDFPSQHFSSSAWHDMDQIHDVFETCSAEALLIGWVGKNVGMNYGDDGSHADDQDLANFISSLGISCQYGYYDENIVTQSLLDSIPVVASAYGNTIILGIPAPRSGHSFIIDGYRSVKNKIYRTYVKYNPVEYLDTLDTGCVVFEPDLNDYYVTVSETAPIIEQIRMNWGWSGEGNDNNDHWFTLTGNWHTYSGDDQYDFDYRRKMIYGFHAI